MARWPCQSSKLCCPAQAGWVGSTPSSFRQELLKRIQDTGARSQNKKQTQKFSSEFLILTPEFFFYSFSNITANFVTRPFLTATFCAAFLKPASLKLTV